MPVASAGEPSPLRCPREGRCGAGAPVAHASSQVLGSRRRGFPRVAVLRLAPLRCARSTRPPLGPLSDLRLRRRFEPPPPLRAGEGPSRTAQAPCKPLCRTFTPSPHSLRGPALKGAQNGLERLLEIPAPVEHPPSRERAAAPARKCDDVHSRNARVDLHRALGRCSIDPSPPRERNSPDRPPQSSGGLAARPEELTRGAEIPSQLGGFASTRWPGRTGLRRDTPPGALSQVDHRYKARTARIAGYRQSSPPASGKALRVPRIPGS